MNKQGYENIKELFCCLRDCEDNQKKRFLYGFVYDVMRWTEFKSIDDTDNLIVILQQIIIDCNLISARKKFLELGMNVIPYE